MSTWVLHVSHLSFFFQCKFFQTVAVKRIKKHVFPVIHIFLRNLFVTSVFFLSTTPKQAEWLSPCRQRTKGLSVRVTAKTRLSPAYQGICFAWPICNHPRFLLCPYFVHEIERVTEICFCYNVGCTQHIIPLVAPLKCFLFLAFLHLSPH